MQKTTKEGKVINYEKDPKLARRLAKEQKKLRKLRQNAPEGKNHGRSSWDITFDNFVPEPKVDVRERDDEREYQP